MATVGMTSGGDLGAFVYRAGSLSPDGMSSALLCVVRTTWSALRHLLARRHLARLDHWLMPYSWLISTSSPSVDELRAWEIGAIVVL